MWREMKEVMKALSSCYAELAEVSGAKHKALAAMDLKAIERVVKEEERFAAEIERLETRRKAALRVMAEKEAGIRPTMKLRELLAQCPDRRIAGELAALHEELDRRMKEVERFGERNTLLAEGALAAVTANLNRIGGTAAGASYGAGGKESVTRERRFDFKA